MTASPYETTEDPGRVFLAALPHHARRVFALDYRTIPAIRACHDNGINITDLAQRCAKGTQWRNPHDTRGLIILRLMKAAGIDTAGDDG